MRLYLAQHGKAESKDVDPDRPLTDQGRDDVQRVAARLAAKPGLDVRRIVHSGKTRARQTAEQIGEILGGREPIAVEEGDDLGPTDDTSVWARRVDGGEDGVLLVGHLPFMERIAARLVTGREDGPMVATFTQGGVLCLGKDAEGDAGWTVRWFVTPGVA